MEMANAKVAPAMIPDFMSGSSILQKAFQGVAPKLTAACITRGLIFPKTAVVDLITKGKNEVQSGAKGKSLEELAD